MSAAAVEARRIIMIFNNITVSSLCTIGASSSRQLRTLEQAADADLLLAYNYN